MTKDVYPKKGEWYRGDMGRVIQVVAYDEDNDAIEAQFFEGEVAEFNIENRRQLDVELVEPPENWSGPFDDLVPGEKGDTERPMYPTDWNGPADEIDRED